MISKDTFCKVLSLIKEQDEIYDNVGIALESVMDGHFVVGTENRYFRALFLVLKEIFPDKDDYISWWLYEDVEKIVYDSLDTDTETWNLTEPEALYDFLTNNRKSKEGKKQ